MTERGRNGGRMTKLRSGGGETERQRKMIEKIMKKRDKKAKENMERKAREDRLGRMWRETWERRGTWDREKMETDKEKEVEEERPERERS